jgi:hypothetical protein
MDPLVLQTYLVFYFKTFPQYSYTIRIVIRQEKKVRMGLEEFCFLAEKCHFS